MLSLNKLDGAEEFGGIGNTCESEHVPALQILLPTHLDRCCEKGFHGSRRHAHDTVGSIAFADFFGCAEAWRNWLISGAAHRPTGNEVAIADTSRGVDDDQSIVDGELRALKSRSSMMMRSAPSRTSRSAPQTAARNHGQCLAGEQQRLVADRCGVVVMRIDDGLSRQASRLSHG